MAFRLGAAIGGAAKRASEILDEERKEAVSMTEDALKTWTQMGLPKAMERREKNKNNKKLAKQLSDNKFSVDQIAVIMGQGKGQEVLSYLDAQRSKYGSRYQIPHGEIVTISGTYEDTGLTIDQILENVQGKVNRGMSIGDAVQDTTGKNYTGGLTGLFGGDNTALMKQKMEAFGAAAGVDINELRALAADDITYDDPLRKGTISLSDPADDPLKVSFINRFEKAAVIGLGGKANIVDGNVVTEEMDNTRTQQSIRISALANKKFKELQKGGAMSETDAYAETLDFIYNKTAELRNPAETTISSFEGLTAGQLPGAIENALSGATGPETMSIQQDAVKALKAAYLNQGTMNEAEAEEAAKAEMARILKRIND